jgi:Tfp pilus assembly protein PilF
MREIKANEFACRMRSLMYEQHAKFTFFLGAGCSISSGILGASGMVKDWLRRLKIIKKMNDEQFREWTLLKLPNYADDIAANYYGIVMEELFFSPQERQTEIEHLIEGKDPGFGYAILAQLITHEFFGKYCNLVLTTNFDDLVADALYIYTNKKPLNIPHESLIGFAKIRDFRPTIIKVHGDARLAPLNTEVEISNIDDKLKETLKTFFSDTALVFIGYGGNDKSILDTLSEIPIKDLPNLIFWVNERIPENEFGVWLRDHNAIWVNHLDFDELMLLVKFEFKLPLPQNDRFEKLINSIGEKFKALQNKIFMLSESPEKEVLVEAAKKTVGEFKDWWSVELAASEFKKSNPDRANDIYLAGLKKFKDSTELLCNYASFLWHNKNDFPLAEKYYMKAIMADPSNPSSLGNYALFLKNYEENYPKAEEYFKKAIEANPNNAINLGNYANYKRFIIKDYLQTEKYYKMAIEEDPHYGVHLGNYSGFLFSMGRHSEALPYLTEAIIYLYADGGENEEAVLECWFYQYAHVIDDSQSNKSLKKIKKLISKNVNSPFWNFDDNVARAIQDGHPEPEFLKALADVITDKAPVESLDQFEVWTNIKI